MKDIYVAMYKTDGVNILLGTDTITIPKSDIVSISFMHNYDTATFPIIRFRIYSDLDKIQTICEHPDTLSVASVLQGGIYKMNDDEKNPTLMCGTEAINISGSGYIENKNIVSSSFDKYEQGESKSSDLNDNIKSPLEIYCYPKQTIHYMRARVNSIYKEASMNTVITDIFKQANINKSSIDAIINPIKYDQVLIPNMTVIQSISYLDKWYGLYTKGGMLYGDLDTVYLCNTSVSNGTTPIPLYVESYKNTSDMSGMQKVGDAYRLSTLAPNVSITTDTDIETTLHGPKLAAINLMNMNDIEIVELTNLFEDIDKASTYNLAVPNLLHKTKNKFTARSYVARLDEHITKVDVSGAGFDITLFKPTSRFNLLFASTLRGINMNKLYRPTFVNHVLSNTDSGLLIAQTTMHLCTN